MLALEKRWEMHMEMTRLMREKKLAETEKKMGRYDMDADDYHFLVPPEGYSFTPVATHPNGDFYGYLGWGINIKRMYETMPPVVQPFNAMAGNMFGWLQSFRTTDWPPEFSYAHLMPLQKKYDIDHGIGQAHHFAGDVRIGFKLGFGGLLNKVREYAKLHVKDEESRNFYAAHEMLLLGIQSWIRNTIACMDDCITKEENPFFRENLLGMKQANEWLVENPPRTLREACQFMCWYNLAGRAYNREGAGGQLDDWLRPYFERDLASGLIDEEEAVFYLTGLLMSDTKYYQLGGPDDKGRDMVSPISWLVLEAADRLNVASNLTVRVHDGLNQDFFKRSVELLFKHKNAWPRFSGDESLVRGFMRSGYSAELARQRIAVGCHWMALPAREYCMNDSIKVNLARVFEIAYQEMAEQKEAPSVALLWDLFQKHLAAAVEVVKQGIDWHLQYQKYNSPELFLNLFCSGPIEKGRDASDKGLDFYNIGVDAAGNVVAADSFAALEQRVEKERRFTWEAVTHALKNDFSGDEGEYIRQMLRAANKFGQYGAPALDWAKRITEAFTALCSGVTPGGARLIPGLFSWSKTIRFGKAVGATPDGRKAGQPINHGTNPMPGSVQNGAMTTMSAAIAAVQPERGNTAPFQMELDPNIDQEEGGVEKVMALLKTHLDTGGTLINVNILDADKIRAAHANPALYPDLVVRVTGFTAYFMTLSPAFRQLVVDRMMEAQG